MSDPATVQRRRGRDDGAGGWPVDENVLLSLSEYVRPTVTDRYLRRRERVACTVAAAVHACLAERVEPTPTAQTALRLLRRANRLRRPSERDSRDDDGAVVLASKRMQTRLMAVRSKHPADDGYYASDATHVSRTVEELSGRVPTDDADNCSRTVLTYTLGTVFHDRDTGTCHLRGLTDPRCRVPVDCSRLAVLPRHGRAVKMFSVLRGTPAVATDGPRDPAANGGPAVLVPHHFQVFSAAAAAAVP